MRLGSIAARLASMDAAEFRFRAATEARKQLDRVRYRVRPARWDRRSLARVLDPSAGPLVGAAADAARAGSFAHAHASLQRHFVGRRSFWPVGAGRRTAIAKAIVSRFPDAPARAANDGARVLQGRCDLLGYRDLAIGHPPAWHVDPVHHRSAPTRFWADVPYLDAAVGDHKIIWEINRHQHWLTLGRAYWLTGDARFRDGCIAQITDWIQKNLPLTGINWSSMLELAFRSLSWTWAIEFFAAAPPAADADRETPWLVDLLVALDAQLTQIARNMSVYFSPNTHLTGEALALYAVSLALPELRGSAARIELGRSVLLKEASRQILKDGGHAERSHHYHRYSTDFYLLALIVARAAADPAAVALEGALRAQADYLRIIVDDRGQLPLIGDDDGGQLFMFGSRPADAAPTLNAAAMALDEPALAIGAPGPDTCWILGDARTPPPAPRTSPPGPHLLSESGYFVHRQSRSQLIFDVGRHGFLNQGHAHADALSIAATVDGDPVLVDPGTATYTMDRAMRDRFRSPRMHNTLTLDDVDFAEPAGPFHWNRIANARVLRYDVQDEIVLVQASHDGYADRRHVRSVVSVPDTGWLVVDHVITDRPTLAQTWWHLHPSWTVSVHDGGCVLQQAGRRTALAFAGGTLEALDDPNLCVYSPEYGRIERAPVLRVTSRDARPFALATFVPSQYELGEVLLQPLKMTLEPAPDRLGSAWRLETERASFDIFVGPRWPQPCARRRRARNEMEQVCAG
jgi:hypothetical protein